MDNSTVQSVIATIPNHAVNHFLSMLDEHYGVSFRTCEYLIEVRNRLDPRNPTVDDINSTLAMVQSTDDRCSQDLYVYGSASDIAEFVEFAKEEGKPLSADKFLPYPQKFKDLDTEAVVARQCGIHSFKDGFNSGGYEWCIDNWGTKWGIYNVAQTKLNLAGSRSQVNYSFDSAWEPANKIVRAMSERFPALRFELKYYEAAKCYNGVYEVIGGRVVHDTWFKYHGSCGKKNV